MAIIKKTGTEVIVTSPIKKTYQVETEETNIAVGIAWDTMLRRGLVSESQVKDFKYKTKPYTYKDVSWW